MKRSRYKNRTGQRRLPLLAILGISFGAAVLIALITGLVLNAVLDDETYYRLTTKPRQTVNDTILFAPIVPDLVAYPYAFGDDITEASGRSAIDVSLNDSSGKYLYTSEVLTSLKVDDVGKTRLSSSLLTLSEYNVYVSGIFYPQAARELDATKRYAKEALETAALREFFYFGGDDIVLCGLDLFERTEACLSYLKTIKLAVGDNAVGVAVSYEEFTKDDTRQLFERLLTVCDFLALDLCEVPDNTPLDELLAANDYAYTQYHMRLLFGEKQSALIAGAQKLSIRNRATLK